MSLFTVRLLNVLKGKLKTHNPTPPPTRPILYTRTFFPEVGANTMFSKEILSQCYTLTSIR